MKSIRLAFLLLLDLAVSAPIGAQAIGGELAPKSRAAVRISVTTMPRFDLERESDLLGPAGSTVQREAVSARAPGLRYSVLAEARDSKQACVTKTQPQAAFPPTCRAGDAGRPGTPLLLIVIPD